MKLPTKDFFKRIEGEPILNFVLGKYTIREAVSKFTKRPIGYVNDVDYSFDELINISRITNGLATCIYYECGADDLCCFLNDAFVYLQCIRLFIAGYNLKSEATNMNHKENYKNAFKVFKKYFPSSITDQDFEKLYSDDWLDEVIYNIDHISKFLDD